MRELGRGEELNGYISRVGRIKRYENIRTEIFSLLPEAKVALFGDKNRAILSFNPHYLLDLIESNLANGGDFGDRNLDHHCRSGYRWLTCYSEQSQHLENKAILKVVYEDYVSRHKGELEKSSAVREKLKSFEDYLSSPSGWDRRYYITSKTVDRLAGQHTIFAKGLFGKGKTKSQQLLEELRASKARGGEEMVSFRLSP